MEEPQVDTKRLRKGSQLAPGQDFMLRLLNATMDDDSNNKHFFGGYSVLITLFQIYLAKRYGSRCLVRSVKDTADIGELGLFLAFERTPDMKLKDITPKETFEGLKESFARCLNLQPPPPVIFLYLSLSVKREASHGSHANMILYRTATKTFEHFEPHGAAYNNNVSYAEVINETLQKALQKICPEPFTYVTSQEVCPREVSQGLQSIEAHANLGKNDAIEGGGYCAAWSMFFAEMCLRNPTLSGRQVFELIIDFLKKNKGKDMHVLRHIMHSYTTRMGKVLYEYFSLVLNHASLLDKAASTIKWGKNEVNRSLNPENMSRIVLHITKNCREMQAECSALMSALRLIVELESAQLTNAPESILQEMGADLEKQMQDLKRLVGEYMNQSKQVRKDTTARYFIGVQPEFVPPRYAPPGAPKPVPPEVLQALEADEQALSNVQQQAQSFSTTLLPKWQSKVRKYQNPDWWTKMTQNVPAKLAEYQTRLAEVQSSIADLERSVSEGQERVNKLRQEIEEMKRDKRPTYDAEYQAKLAAAKKQFDEAKDMFGKDTDALEKLKALRDQIAPLYQQHYSRATPVLGGKGRGRRTRKRCRK